jgi:hypothetical protein
MRFATGPQTNLVVPITGNYTFSEEDAYASIQAAWGGGTVTLPGPTNGRQPSNGDTYGILDPQNKVGATLTLTVHGGGYSFLSGGVLVSQTSLNTLVSSTNGAIQKNCLVFIFDAVAQTWGLC